METTLYGDIDRALGEFVGNGGVDLAGSTDRHCALVDDYLVVGHQAADITRGGKHVLKVGGAVLVGRRTDGDELDGAMVNGLVDVGREVQATGGHIAPDHFLQPRFVDGYAASFKDADLFRIDIKAENVIAHFGQTGATDQSNVTGADDGDFHVYFLQGLIEFFAAPW